VVFNKAFIFAYFVVFFIDVKEQGICHCSFFLRNSHNYSPPCMNRLIYLFDFAWLSLRRHWPKHLGLAIVYAVVVAFFASVVLFSSALKRESEIATAALPELWVQRIAGGRLVPTDTALVKELRAIRGVKQVFPRIWGYVFDSPTGAVFSIIGSDARLQGLPLQLSVPLGSIGVGQALCGAGLLKARGLEIGEKLTLQDSQGDLRAYRIVGVFDAPTDLLTHDLIVLSPQDARQILGLQNGQFTDIALSVSNSAEVGNVGKKIDQQYGGIRVVSKEELQQTYSALFGWRGGLMVYGFLVSMLAFLMMAWDRAASLGGRERKELAILKGLGWGIGDVLLYKVLEALIIALTATLLGIVLAYLHVFVAGAPLIKPFLIGWSQLYPAYQLYPYFSAEDMMLILCLSLMPYLSAVLIPAWRGAIIEPASAMR
jgi:hypothetical protein